MIAFQMMKNQEKKVKFLKAYIIKLILKCWHQEYLLQIALKKTY